MEFGNRAEIEEIQRNYNNWQDVMANGRKL